MNARRALAGASLLALAISAVLPTWKPGQDPFLPGFAVLIASFVFLQLAPAAIATLLVVAHLVAELAGRPRRSTALVAVLGVLLAAGTGVYLASISDVGIRRCGPGYWLWGASLIGGVAVGWARPRP